MHTACAHTHARTRTRRHTPFVQVRFSIDLLAVLGASRSGQSSVCLTLAGERRGRGAPWATTTPTRRPAVSATCSPSSSTGASVRCRHCPARPVGPARSRKSGCFATWWAPWRRLCRSCPPASGARSRATSSVSVRPCRASLSNGGSGVRACNSLVFLPFSFATSLHFVLCLSLLAFEHIPTLTEQKGAPFRPQWETMPRLKPRRQGVKSFSSKKEQDRNIGRVKFKVFENQSGTF